MSAALRARIPAAADARDIRVEDLADRMELKPGELRIEFYGAEDLAAKLFELSRAMANDWQTFARSKKKAGRRRRIAKFSEFTKAAGQRRRASQSV